jgi:hypothetical protein
MNLPEAFVWALLGQYAAEREFLLKRVAELELAQRQQPVKDEESEDDDGAS